MTHFFRAFRRGLLLLIVLCLISFDSFALGGTRNKPYAFEISWQHFFFNYKEELSPPFKSTERGELNGFHTSLMVFDETRYDLPWYGRFIFEFTDNPTIYDGALHNLATNEVIPYKSRTQNTILRLAGNLGLLYSWSFIDITPYSGLDYRAWLRHLRGNTPFREAYSWLSIPLGLRTQVQLGRHVSLGVDASYQVMISGDIKIYLSDIDDVFNDPEAKLGNRPGWRLELPLVLGYLVLTPWYEYYGFGKSNTSDWNYEFGDHNIKIGEVYEPASSTYLEGLNLGVRLTF